MTETSTLEPTNPYSAAKAGAEMMTKAYMTRCTLTQTCMHVRLLLTKASQDVVLIRKLITGQSLLDTYSRE